MPQMFSMLTTNARRPPAIATINQNRGLLSAVAIAVDDTTGEVPARVLAHKSPLWRRARPEQAIEEKSDSCEHQRKPAQDQPEHGAAATATADAGHDENGP